MPQKKIDKIEKNYENQHQKTVDYYAKQVEKIYNDLVNEAVIIAGSISNIDPNKIFTFDDYPQTKQRYKNLLDKHFNKTKLNILVGVEQEWDLGAKKNDAIIENIINLSKVKKKDVLGYGTRNLQGMRAFQDRKRDGMNLSDRVWELNKRLKNELELALDIGIGEGKSGADLARDVKKYLKEPNKLFRRIRDKYGNLKLSKAAKAYNPGAGIYRSSYKNALRMTRTEINMSYRTSDHNRMQQNNMIVGFMVNLSNRHKIVDICDDLKGKYPKTFKFVGWHPQCLCYVTTILATENELNEIELKLLNDESIEGFKSVNMVNKMPSGFNKWMKEHSDAYKFAEKSGTLPYFIRDNFKGGKFTGGLSI